MSKLKAAGMNILVACALLFQVFFVTCLTVWYDVIIIPNQWLCPPVTREYWFWYIEERVPAVVYESQLVSVCSILKLICCIVFFLGVYQLLKQALALKSKGFWAELLLVAIMAAIYMLVLAYNRVYGQPYRLYMTMVLPELTSLLILGLFSLQYRKIVV